MIQICDASFSKLMMDPGNLSSDSDAERSHTSNSIQRSSDLAIYAVLKSSAFPCRIFAAQNLPRPVERADLASEPGIGSRTVDYLIARSKPRSIWPSVASVVRIWSVSTLEACWPQELSGSCGSCGSFRRNGYAANSTVVHRSGRGVRRWQALVKRFPTRC